VVEINVELLPRGVSNRDQPRPTVVKQRDLLEVSGSAELCHGWDNPGMALNEGSGRGHACTAKDRADHREGCFHNVAYAWA